MGIPTGQPHYERGTKPNVACVFSCPGRHEAAAGHPAAHSTGRHLAVLSDILSDWGADCLPDREQVTITNAWDRVEYPALTGRSEAAESEVLSPDNLQRLAREIGGTRRYIFCFGARAQKAVEALQRAGRLQPGCQVIRAPHLSPLFLNRRRKDIWGNPIEPAAGDRARGARNTRLRLEHVALSIMKQIDPSFSPPGR